MMLLTFRFRLTYLRPLEEYGVVLQGTEHNHLQSEGGW